MANHEDDCTFDIDNITSELELLNNLVEYATDNKKILASRLDRATSLRIEYTTRDGRIKETTYIEHYG
ncbi:hypothetical protein HanIR_Chr01g0012871 [Helianthus annuus]|nr:hypothetical protein HanIR_Chr01g0012871 [Helianthus annuus]